MLEDDGVVLDCPHAHAPALLRSVYPRAFAVDDVPSLLRYGRWLPRGRALATSARSAVYRSTALAAHLGLRELWIAFSGWWPERGATLETTTFKELEAYAVLGRLARDEDRTLVISSAVTAVIGGGASGMAGMFRPDMSSLAAYLTPARIVSLVISSISSALVWPVLLTPAAAIYKSLPGVLGETGAATAAAFD